jgi:hypothetical protein
MNLQDAVNKMVSDVMAYVPRYSPSQYEAWREMVKNATEEPEIVAYTGWSKGGRGYSPSRYTVRKWSNVPSGMEEYSVHLDHDNGRSFDYYFAPFARAVTFDEAIAEIEKQLNFNQRNTKPKSPNRMKNEVIICP